jgi:FkbM family methyltransferase
MTTLAAFRTYAMANMMQLEAILAEVYQAHCADRSGFVLFDGGAHRAYHTIRMLDLPGCQRVYAVEADPFMAETLDTTLRRARPAAMDRVVMVRKALQDNPFVVEIPWRSSPSHAGRSSIVSANADRPTIWTGNQEMQYRDEITVPATTIDAVLAAETAPLPFLKLDLEGADLLSLMGARKTLLSRRPIVAFENSVHAPRVHGFALSDMAAYFDQLDYVPVDFLGMPINPDTWFGFFEAWAVPREAESWLRGAVQAAVAARIA